MSAKGDQVGERFVKVMGIVDYITKPFSPEAITAVVQHTIGKYGPATTRRPSRSSPAKISPRPTTPIARTRARRLAPARPGRRRRRARGRRAVRARRRGRGRWREGHDRRRRDRRRGAHRARRRAARHDARLDRPRAVRRRRSRRCAATSASCRSPRCCSSSTCRSSRACSRSSDRGARVDIYFRRGRVDQAIAERRARGVPARPLRRRRRADDARGLRGVPRVAPAADRPRKLIGQQLVKLGYLAEAELEAVR